MVTVDLEVEYVGCRSVVMDEGRKVVGVVGCQRKFAEDRPGRFAGKVGACALFETHTAVASQKNRVLHSTARNDACQHRECSGGSVAMQGTGCSAERTSR